MKKKFSSPVIAFSLLFSLQAFSKEMAQASADVIATKFKNSAGGLSITDFNSLMAAEVCVYENFLDFAREFERVLLRTPDLNINEINQVRDLIKLKVTSEEHVKTIKTLVPADYDRIIAAIANLRRNGKLPGEAATLGMTVGNVLPTVQTQAYDMCSAPDFLSLARPSLDAATLDAKVNYLKSSSGSSSDLGVIADGNGSMIFDISSLGIKFTTSQTTLRNLLIKGTMPR